MHPRWSKLDPGKAVIEFLFPVLGGGGTFWPKWGCARVGKINFSRPWYATRLIFCKIQALIYIKHCAKYEVHTHHSSRDTPSYVFWGVWVSTGGKWVGESTKKIISQDHGVLQGSNFAGFKHLYSSNIVQNMKSKVIIVPEILPPMYFGVYGPGTCWEGGKQTAVKINFSGPWCATRLKFCRIQALI